MNPKLDDPPLRVYKWGLLFVIGIIFGATQDILFDEVVVWSRETQLQVTSEVTLARPQAPATPTPTIHPNAFKINRFLSSKGSPMSGLGSAYVAAAEHTGVDPFLMVAISGKESSFGKHACGYNAWGIGNCRWGFRSYEHGIEYLGRLLAQPRYKNRSVHQIAHTYCPPSSGCNTAKWIADVNYFIHQLRGPEIAMQTP